MYHLPEGYRTHESVPHFDDTSMKDEYQNEVYYDARTLFDLHGLKNVLDIGCGSAFKLLKYFQEVESTGVEIEPTLTYLRSKYPDGRWINPEMERGEFDMVICADVIEHVENPEELITLINSIKSRFIVFSTPDRSLIQGADQLGPPRNLHHVREWSFDEFGEYISDHFDVLAHFISNREQATQVIVCTQKSPAI